MKPILIRQVENLLAKFEKLEVNKLSINEASHLLHALSFLPANQKDKRISLINNIISSLTSQKAQSNISDLEKLSITVTALVKFIDIDQNVILNIMQFETKPGGPYYTYRPEEVDDNIVDPIINAHLLYFLGLLKVNLPKTKKFLINSLENNLDNTENYLYFLYAFARYASTINSKDLRNKILNSIQSLAFNNLPYAEKILYALTINYLGLKLSDSELSSIIKKNEIIENTKANELLRDILYLELLLLEAKNRSIELFLTKDQAIINAITIETFKLVHKELAQSPFKKALLKEFPVERTKKAINIVCLIALDLNINMKRNEKKLVDLCTAAFFCWMGYTILDDYIDQKKYSLKIPAMIFALNAHQKFILQLINNNKTLTKRMYTARDITIENYLWESINARFDQKSKLPKTFSYGYIEKRMSVFLQLLSLIPHVFKQKNAEEISKKIYMIFANIMIIDQLNDDAHDWKVDMDDGILTYVTHHILTNTNDRQKYEDIFATKTTYKVVAECKKIYIKTFKLLKQSSLNKNTLMFLDKSYNPIVKVELELEKVRKLMDYYSK